VHERRQGFVVDVHAADLLALLVLKAGEGAPLVDDALGSVGEAQHWRRGEAGHQQEIMKSHAGRRTKQWNIANPSPYCSEKILEYGMNAVKLALAVCVGVMCGAVSAQAPGAASGNAAQSTYTLRFQDDWLPKKVQRDRQATAPVDMIMLHFCSDCIEHPENPYNYHRIMEIFTSVTVSAHYLIDREGVVHRFVPETNVAYHAGRGNIDWMPERANKLNEYSIGIEMLNISTWNDMALFKMPKEKYDAIATKHPDWIGYTDAQYAALKALIEQIRSRHPAIVFDRKHIIGHSEYAGTGRRTDPGELFDYTRIGLPQNR
jgi:N-acetylmuramoyl-L-alanine amidase